MRLPATWTVYDIKEYNVQEGINNIWQFARPLSSSCLCLIRRLKLSYLVFTGKCDVLDWTSHGDK